MDSSSHPASLSSPSSAAQDGSQPQLFANAIAHLQQLALQEFDREISEKQLCYHNRDHVVGVQHRAKQIFQVVRPYLQPIQDCDRLEYLLDLCAVTHDLIQVFVPQTAPQTPRHRDTGVSEYTTIARVLELIKIHVPDQFTDTDVQLIRDAIAATICAYDPTEQAIFQPALYQSDPAISAIARILALADLGTLGIEGITAYNAEGCLLFLEENPDVRSLIENHQLDHLAHDFPIYDNIRQRLLRRTRFQVNLAQSRLKRCPEELAAFPAQSIPVLTHEVFRYLTPATIAAIVDSTPTADDTPLKVLANFFQFESALADTRRSTDQNL